MHPLFHHVLPRPKTRRPSDLPLLLPTLITTARHLPYGLVWNDPRHNVYNWRVAFFVLIKLIPPVTERPNPARPRARQPGPPRVAPVHWPHRHGWPLFSRCLIRSPQAVTCQLPSNGSSTVRIAEYLT